MEQYVCLDVSLKETTARHPAMDAPEPSLATYESLPRYLWIRSRHSLVSMYDRIERLTCLRTAEPSGNAKT